MIKKHFQTRMQRYTHNPNPNDFQIRMKQWTRNPPTHRETNEHIRSGINKRNWEREIEPRANEWDFLDMKDEEEGNIGEWGFLYAENDW